MTRGADASLFSHSPTPTSATVSATTCAARLNKGNPFAVGVVHLFLHLGSFGIDQRCHSFGAELRGGADAGGLLSRAEVDEKHRGGLCQVLGEGVEFGEHVVDAVGPERDAHATDVGHAEDAGEIIITASTTDASNLYILGFHPEDGAGIIVQPSGEGEVKFNVTMHL